MNLGIPAPLVSGIMKYLPFPEWLISVRFLPLRFIWFSDQSLGRPSWSRIHLPTQETRVRSLGWEALLEKEMATLSGVLSWKPMGRGAYWAAVPGVAKESDTS